MTDGNLDGCQRARQQDRTCDHDAARRLLIQHQHGPKRQHARLRAKPQDLGDRPEAAGSVTRFRLGSQIVLVCAMPAGCNAMMETHGKQDFAVLARAVCNDAATAGEVGCKGHRFSGLDVRQKRQDHQQDSAYQRKNADPRMEQESKGNVERHPRQVEERRRPHAGEKAAHLLQIPQCLLTILLLASLQRQTHCQIIDRPRQQPVGAPPESDEEHLPQIFQQTVEKVKHRDDRDQSDQRRIALAGDDPVIDLQHEEGAGERQDVDHATDPADRQQQAAIAGKHGTERQRLPALQTGRHRRARPRIEHCLSRSPVIVFNVTPHHASSPRRVRISH